MSGILLVEDEEAIKRKLMNNVPWHDYGFDPVLGASNGQEALDLLEQHPIEIVVTDIQMPVMNGIDLIKEIKKRNYRMKIIVISGFAEFEYARESINLAVSEYLLKPFATKRLLDVALRVKGEMSEEQAKEEEIATLRAQISNNMPALREKFLADLLNGKMTESDFEAKLQFLGLDAYEKRPYQVVVMELHDSPDAPEDKYLLDLQFYQHIEWALKSSSYQFLLLNYYHHQIVAVVFNPDRDLPLCLEKWLTRLRVHLNKDITFGISNCYQALSDLSVAHREAGMALQNRFLYGFNRVYAVGDLNLVHPGYHKIFFQLYQNRIFDDLRIGAYDEILEDLERLFAEMRSYCLGPEPIRIIAANLLLLTCATLIELGYDLEEIFEDGVPPLSVISRTQCLNELEEVFKGIFSRVNHIISQNRECLNQQRVDEIRRYLETNYAEDITLSAMAEKYKISPGYLSLLFTERTGKKFSDYLTDCRINKAKELLKHTEMRIYEIATAVGYNDPYYFSSCFKKITNKTPSEYRENFEKQLNRE
ncbi:MAG: response regulator [Firmicutes bacterium]|nr:response regulator [Bacillota bacterium]